VGFQIHVGDLTEKKNVRKRTQTLRESSLRVSEALSRPNPWSGTTDITGFGGTYEDIILLIKFQANTL